MLAPMSEKKEGRPAHRPRGKKPARPTVYISVTMAERLEIEKAALSKGYRAVSEWARGVLLEAARKTKG